MLKSPGAFSPVAPACLHFTRLVHPGRLDTHVISDPQGNLIRLIQARLVSDCSLPVMHPISARGPLRIAKFDPAGGRVLFATCLGEATSADATGGICLRTMQTDRDGNILLPAVNALQSAVKGTSASYVIKVAADGSRIVFATYLGGSGYDAPQAIAAHARGAAWMLVFTSSFDFPVTPGAPSSNA